MGCLSLPPQQRRGGAGNRQAIFCTDSCREGRIKRNTFILGCQSILASEKQGKQRHHPREEINKGPGGARSFWAILQLPEERGWDGCGRGGVGGGSDGELIISQPLEAFVLFSCAKEAAALLPAVQKLASFSECLSRQRDSSRLCSGETAAG